MNGPTAGIIQEATPFEGPGEMLYRRAVRPAAASWARLAIVHGYGDHSGRYAEFMQWMAERGVECHALDLRGQGASAGRRGFVTRWEDYLEDVRAFLALPAVRERPGVPLFLLGHSHGGLVVAAAAISGVFFESSVRGCILSSPFLRSRLPSPRRNRLLAHILNPFVPWLCVANGLNSAMMSSDPAMRLDNQNDPLCLRIATPRWYLGQLRAQQYVLARAADFRLPLLILAGGADPIADPDAAIGFAARAGAADKSHRLYPGHLHELLRETNRQAIFSDILDWLRPRASRACSPE